MKILVNARMALGVMAVCAGCLPEVTFRYACAGDAACDDARDVSSGETDITVPTDGTLGDGATDGSDAAADASATDANVADAADVSAADATDASAVDAADASATDAGAMDASAMDASAMDASAMDAADVGAADAVDVPDVPRCGAGMVLRAGVCVAVPAARALAPLSGSQATHRRPIVEWVNGEGVDGARVEFCRDRACTMVLATITAVGEQGLSLTELPPGPVWWRVWARSGAVEATTPSAAWLVHVPQRSSGVNTFGAVGRDLNADGYPDLLVGVPAASEVRVYFGGATGLSTTPARVIPGPASSGFGAFFDVVGDIDGDGRVDALISDRAGAVYLVTGQTIDAGTPFSTLPREPGAWVSYLVRPAGDVNGDGLADVAVAMASEIGGRAQLRWMLGNSSGSLSFAPTVLTRVSGGLVVAGTAGDANRDGYADVVVGTLSTSGNQLQVIAGAAALSTTPAVIESSPLAQGVVANVVTADFQGRRRHGAFCGLFQGNDNVVFHNPARAGLTEPLVFRLPETMLNSAALTTGDFNGDGLADVAVNVPMRAHVFQGAASGFTAASTYTLPQHYKAVAADFNGDGFADLAVAETVGTDLCVGVRVSDASGPSRAALTSPFSCRRFVAGEDVVLY